MGVIRTIRAGGARVIAMVGDLTKQQVDAVVNAANETLVHGGGVAAALVGAGGRVIQDESDEWVRANGAVGPGEAAVTSAGAMPAAHVIHVVGPRFRAGRDNESLLRAAVAAALEAAVEVGDRSIAFPAISAGIFGYPMEAATAVIADEVVGWLRSNPGRMDEVLLVGFTRRVGEAFAAGLNGVDAESIDS